MATIEKVATFAAPGQVDSPVELKSLRELHRRPLGGAGEGPVRRERDAGDGEPFIEGPRLTPEGVEFALDAAHAAKDAWGETSTTDLLD